jgi:hypothetical protein
VSELSLLDAALDCASRGRAVFPVNANKKPCIPKEPGGNGFKDATTDEAVIRRWVGGSTPGAGIVTPTGPDWLVLDAHDPDALARLEREHGPLPATVEVVTPRPGAPCLPARRGQQQPRWATAWT